MRTRTRTFPHLNYSLANGTYPGISTVEYFWESGTNGCNCFHWIHSPINGTHAHTDPNQSWHYSSYHVDPLPLINWARKACFSAWDDLNWSKLPTSNEAGLIQILAEMDETLLTFTKKFWQSLTYGKMTWGVLPFLSDLQAIAKTIKNLAVDLSKFDYEDQVEVQIPPYGKQELYDVRFDGRVCLGGKAVIRKTGIGDISYYDGLSHLLDRIGLHPDIATVWDLIPLSFVVDYLLPIGDYLESLSGNWVQTMYFRGWLTAKYEIKCSWWNGGPEYGLYGFTPTHIPFDVHCFERWNQSCVLVVPERRPLSFKQPGPKQLFNMLYLAILGKYTKL